MASLLERHPWLLPLLFAVLLGAVGTFSARGRS
jgi:hypothetical protein